MRRGLFALVLVGGCFDFVGDRGEIGFTSDLVVDGMAWAKDAAVADGTAATFTASERLSGDPLEVVGRASRLRTLAVDGESITVTGDDERGVLTFAGNTEDRFDVRFAAPAEVRWRHAAGGTTGDVQVLAGATVPLVAAVRDRRGRPLAYRASDDGTDLHVTADGDGAAWTDGPLVMVQAGDLGPMALSAALNGVSLPASGVSVVAADQVVGVDLVPLQWTGFCGVLAVGRTADGREVLGAAVAVTDPVQPPDDNLMPEAVAWDCDGPPLVVRAVPVPG